LSYEVHDKYTKDNLIRVLLHFYKNEEEEKCRFWDLSPNFTNRQTNLKNTHFYFESV